MQMNLRQILRVDVRSVRGKNTWRAEVATSMIVDGWSFVKLEFCKDFKVKHASEAKQRG